MNRLELILSQLQTLDPRRWAKEQEEAEIHARDAQIGEQLRTRAWRELMAGLELEDEDVLDEKIHAIRSDACLAKHYADNPLLQEIRPFQLVPWLPTILLNGPRA